MKKDTRQRLLDAAERAFARAGWTGATTHEISRLAKVNEVTLFRHFKSKKHLFEAVIGRFLEGRRQVVAEGGAEDSPLEAVLGRYAESYYRSLQRSPNLVRTFLAEYSRHPATLRSVIEGVAKPFRDELVSFLKRRQARGEVRRGVDCAAALEVFSGMLFSHAVKPCLEKPGYSTEDYLRLCVEIFHRGIRP